MKPNPILEIHHVSIAFRQYKGMRQTLLPVIHDLNVTVYPGEIVAVVGASGSGKSLLAHAILGILPYNAQCTGEMNYNGEPLTPKRKKQLRGHEMVLIPQGVTYLDPLMKIGAQLQNGDRSKEAKERINRYGLPAKTAEQYPHELSGGMARRVLISTAVLKQPHLVIADEPTPGLHVSAAKRVLSHFREIADEGAGVLLITHDLEIALEAADRVLVFYAGQTVEEASSADFTQEETLRHPYTRALWQALPQNGFVPLPGRQPYAGEAAGGCTFAPRCMYATKECQEREIPYQAKQHGFVRCLCPWEESI